jgi:Type I phosphodiesterase / nucleotide pyrophosphatase
VIGVTIDGRKGHAAKIVVTNAEQGRAAVNTIRQAGADFIKVYQFLSREAYFAIADEAKRQQMPFAGHLPHAISAQEAARAGQRSIEHSIAPNFFCFSNERELRRATEEGFGTDEGKDALIKSMIDNFDSDRCADGFRRLAEAGVWRTPTLMTLPARMFDDRWLEDPRNVYVGTGLRRMWDQARSLKDRNASALWQADGEWMSHRIDSAAAVRYSGLFPTFEADAMTAMIEREPVGADNVADLILLNYKGADFVGHKYGPDSSELRVTLGEMDRHLTRMLRALEAKVGNNYLLAVTADHGMPSEPSSPDRRHFAQSIVDLLHETFDPEAKQLITSFEPENSQIFVDEDRLSALRLTLRDLAHFLESQPFLFAVFTRDDVRLAANAAK